MTTQKLSNAKAYKDDKMASDVGMGVFQKRIFNRYFARRFSLFSHYSITKKETRAIRENSFPTLVPNSFFVTIYLKLFSLFP